MAPRLGWFPTPWDVVPLYSWGLAVGLGWVSAWWVTARLVRGQRHLPHRLVEAWLPVGLGASIGTWGLGAASTLPFQRPLEPSSSGAVLGALLAGGWWLRRRHASLLASFDALVPGALLAAAFAACGCWLHGCHFGVPLPDSAPRWLIALGALPESSRPPAFRAAAGLHPLPLYLASVLLAASLYAACRLRRVPRLTRHEGASLRGALLLWAVLRVATDTWRPEAWSLDTLLALLLAAASFFPGAAPRTPRTGQRPESESEPEPEPATSC